MGRQVVAQTPFSLDTSNGNGADTYVRLGQPTTNFGGAGNVVVKDSGGGSTTRKGYIRFDLSSLGGVHTGSEIALTTSVNNQGGGGTTPQMFTVNVFGLNDGNAGESWDEGTINFSNAPANRSGNAIGGGALFLGQVTVPNNATPDTVSFSSPAVDAFLNQDTDGNVSFILTRDGGSGSHNLGFFSKESSSISPAPTLSGDTQPGAVQSITTNDGNGADSYVRLGQPGNNFGGSGGVVIKGGSGSTTRKGYLRFDVSDVPQDQVLGAWLELETNANNEGGGSTDPTSFSVNVYGLDDAAAGNNWDESSITWNTAPGNQSGNSIDSTVTELLGTIEVLEADAPDTVLFSTDELLDFLAEDTDGDVTFILQRSAGGTANLSFASKEDSSANFAPTLNFALAVPEPATIAIWSLLGVALVGFCMRRRLGRA